MLRMILVAAAALSLVTLDTADAASKRKKHKVRAVPIATMPAAPVARTPGPIWAGPNECYTDEGYGRYLPCGAGMDM